MNAGKSKSGALRYVSRYFAEFQYRFSRLSRVPEMLARRACVATRLALRPYKALKIACEAGWSGKLRAGAMGTAHKLYVRLNLG